MSQSDPHAAQGSSAKRALGVAIALAFALAVFWRVTLPTTFAWGWDESMHAELPAVRMLVALRHFEVRAAFDALLDCSQYPFVWPVCLAIAQSAFGISEVVARSAGIVAWATALVGVYLLARELEVALPQPRARGVLPWIAFALAALSPLALDFAGTLFLEVPFTCAAIFALLAWVRLSRASAARTLPHPTLPYRALPNRALPNRLATNAPATEDRAQHEGGSHRRAYCAGAWITVALFTKWNYGLLLAFGLALDASVQCVSNLRAGSARAFFARLSRVAAVPAIACVWWFVLPLPGGFAVGSEHRTVLVEFLSGNTQLAPTSAALRIVYAATYFALTPRMLVVLLVGWLFALHFVRDPGVRALSIVLLASGLPVWIHPFHQDRFQIPSGATLWPLAAFGIASVLTTHRLKRWITLASIAVFAVAFARLDTLWLTDQLGLLQKEPRAREYQEQIFAARRSFGSDRPLPTAGLERAEHDALLDLVAANSTRTDTIGWIGVSQALSPAAVQIGLLTRQRNDERFLRDATRPIDITYVGADPGWDDARLSEFAQRFDVVFATDPPDVRDQANRRFPKIYRERLVASGAWTESIVGTVDVARPLQPPRRVTLYACRRNK